MKKVLSGFVLLVALMFLFSLAYAQKETGEYKGITWSFSKGTLSLEGKGFIPSNTPWENYYKQTKVLSIGKDILGLEWWDEFDRLPKLQKIIYATDSFEEVYPSSTLINEVIYTGANPEFQGMNFFASRINKISFENAKEKYLFEGNFLFNSDKTELYYYCGFKKEKVVIPEGVKTIKEGAFANSNIVSVKLPSTLEEIQHRAFGGCESLKAIEIPASCKVIGPGAFMGCKSLKKVKFHQEKIELQGYYTVRGDKIGAGETFAYCSALSEIELPGSEEIPNSIFAGCSKLKKVIFGEGTKRIVSGQSFLGCTKLQTVYVPDDMEFDHLFFVGYGTQPPKKAVILCHAGSNAEKLAKKYKIKYKTISH